LEISDTASRAASSGRHRIATSASSSAAARRAGSLRCADVEVVAPVEQRADPQAGRALVAVDEDHRSHGVLRVSVRPSSRVRPRR
jgi:hypothetical protein